MRRYLYIALGFFAVLIILPLILIFFALESGPRVNDSVVTQSEDARRARTIFREFRALTEANSNKKSLEISEDDVNSIIGLARRAIPTLRGRSIIEQDKLKVRASVKVPSFPGGWLNVEGTVVSSEKGVKLEAARLGPYSLPSSMLIPLAGLILDFSLGDQLGQVAIKSISKVEVSDKKAVFHVALGRKDRKRLARKFKNKVREIAGVGNEEDVRFYYKAMDRAAKARELPTGGSLLPYIRFALNLTLEREGGVEYQKQKQAAILALAIYCGHPKFEQVVGTVGSGRGKWKTRCFYNTFARRGDLSKHFIISAGLKAASDAGFAFAIGEFKELLDSNRGGSGFSFDDLAADRAGIRFAEIVLAADRQKLRRLIDRLESEADIFPLIEGLPAGLTKEQFEERYVNVDSGAYKQVLAEIENRINKLDFYSPDIN